MTQEEKIENILIEISMLKLENAKLKKRISDLSKGFGISPYSYNATINEKPLDASLGVP